MRHKIWRKGDHFQVFGEVLEMDAEAVSLPDKVNLWWGYEDDRGPYGVAHSFLVEDGEISCELHTYDPTWDDDLLETHFQLLGYYTQVEKQGNQITATRLQAACIVIPAGFPAT